jgi:hypothetical protein
MSSLLFIRKWKDPRHFFFLGNPWYHLLCNDIFPDYVHLFLDNFLQLICNTKFSF